MSVSAEMYLVISLMFAVFAAVAAVGTSIVLGVGFERLRAGFEIVKKQTGFFADAIHKLDERTNTLDKKNGVLEKSVASMSGRIDNVEKQTGFFFESLTSLESQILKGTPATTQEEVAVEEEVMPEEVLADNLDNAEIEKTEGPVLSNVIRWTAIEETKELLKASQEKKEALKEKKEASHSLSSSLFNYLLSDNSENLGRIYH